MKTRFVRYAAIASALFLGACLNDTKEVGADKLEVVHEGMPKDSVMQIMGTGPLTGLYADTLRLEKGFRRSLYIVDGKNYEVLYYRELQGNVAEPVQQAKETPIVLANGKVLGWGWRYYVDAMGELKLPSPIEAPRAAETAPAAAPAPTTPPSAPAATDSAKKSGA
jgi:hypothetical protein